MTEQPSYVSHCAAGGLDGFARDRCSFGPTLVVPLMMLWREYRTYCEEWSFDCVSPDAFRFWVEAQRGLHIGERGHGRRRRFVNGMGVRRCT